MIFNRQAWALAIGILAQTIMKKIEEEETVEERDALLEAVGKIYGEKRGG